jgi:hypothetical protein
MKQRNSTNLLIMASPPNPAFARGLTLTLVRAVLLCSQLSCFQRNVSCTENFSLYLSLASAKVHDYAQHFVLPPP